MPSQLYSDPRPFGGLLRRMIERGCPLDKIPALVDAEIASGAIMVMQHLSPGWWLRAPPDGRLLVETVLRSFNADEIFYRERLPAPSPPGTVVIQSQRLIFMRARAERIASRLAQLLAEDPDALKGDGEIAAAKWLALKLRLDDSVKRGDYEAECVEQFKLDSERSYDRVWKAARYLIGLPMQRKGGRASEK
jgi:hypothetical protein